MPDRSAAFPLIFIAVVSFILCHFAIRNQIASSISQPHLRTNTHTQESLAREQTNTHAPNSCTPPENRRIRYNRIQPRCIRIVHVDDRSIHAILQPEPKIGAYRVALHPFNKLQGDSVASIEITCTQSCKHGFNVTGLLADADYVLIVHRILGVRKEIVCQRAVSTISDDLNIISNPGFEDAGDSPYPPTRFFRSEASNPRSWTLFYNGGIRLLCGKDTGTDAAAEPRVDATRSGVVYPRSGLCCAQLGFRSLIDMNNNQAQKFYGLHQSIEVSHFRNTNLFVFGAWYRLSSDLIESNSNRINESPRDAISMIVAFTYSDGTVDDGAIVPFQIAPSALHSWSLNCAALQAPSDRDITHIHISFHLHDFPKGSLFIDDVFLRQMHHLDEAASQQCTRIPSQSDDRKLKSSIEPTSSNYHVHLKAEVRPKYKQLTIAVPCTPERVLRLEAMSRLYAGGPVVAAVLVESEEEVRLFTEIWNRRYWLRQHVDVRFVYMSPEAKAKTSLPINALRNVAVSLARTEFVVMLDVDMTPATDAFACFRNPDALYLDNLLPEDEKTLLMLPVFVSNEGERSARDKNELLNQLGMRKGTSYCINSQKPIKIWKWYTEAEPYDVRFAAGFEPYGIGRTGSYPRFDERFVGYGFNKIAWVYGAERAGYKLLVLPDAFVTHLNHVENDWVQSINVPQYLNTWRRYFSYVAQIS